MSEERRNADTRVCWGCCNFQPITRVYVILCLAQIILYAETGAVPALLVDMTSKFSLTFPEQGYLGGIVYLGLALGAPFTASLFSCFNTRAVLIGSMAVNAIAVILFGIVPGKHTYWLISLRFFVGFTQATLSVFCPVWVDKFATKGNATKWFSWLQITVPLGVMFGYLLGWGAQGLKTAAGEGRECFGDTLACWRIPFLIQALLTIPLCFIFATITETQLKIDGYGDGKNGRSKKNNGSGDMDEDEDEENNENNENNEESCGTVCSAVAKYGSDCWAVVTEFYFTAVLFVLVALYFSCQSVQYWGTDWLVSGRKYNEHQVMLWFIFTSATAPTIGAITGGILIDCLGGYRGSVTQRAFTTGVLFVIFSIGTCFAVATTYWKEGGLAFAVGCLWITLFCGGMVVPALTGMYTASIKLPRLKLLGSSILLVAVSIFANFLCPVVAGFLMRNFALTMDECKGKAPGTCDVALERGFRWSLFMAPIALTFLLVLWIGGCCLHGDRLMSTEKGRDGEDDEDRTPLLSNDRVVNEL